MHNPIKVHWKAALRILTYIKGSASKDLHKKHGHFGIETFFDSSYAGIKEIKSLPMAIALIFEKKNYLIR